jgi:hypothetical protein
MRDFIIILYLIFLIDVQMSDTTGLNFNQETNPEYSNLARGTLDYSLLNVPFTFTFMES